MMKILPIFLLLSMATKCEGHGRMVDPPQRSSLWRFGFDAPVNTDDHSLDCGGMGVMYSTINKGRCGTCGDRFDLPSPRPNEAGGTFGRGIIAHKYKEGQTISVILEITVDHGGWSEFRICPNNDIHKVVTQECLDKNLLKITGSGKRFYHPRVTGFLPVYVELPPGLTCSQCVLQWRWKTDSSNHCNLITKENCCVGCGVQEEFINCADVQIDPSSPSQNINQSAIVNPSFPAQTINQSTIVNPSPPTQTVNQSAIVNPLLPDTFLPMAAILPVKPVPNDKDVSKVTGYVPLDLPEMKSRVSVCAAKPRWRRVLGTYIADMWCHYNCGKTNCPVNLCEASCLK